MLQTLKDLFDQLTAPPAGQSPAEQDHALQLATAVLLVEVMRAEPTLAASERATVLTALRGKFTLTDDERTALHASAESVRSIQAIV